MSKRRALVLGANGQAGSFLCEVLLERGFDVIGTHRRTSAGNLDNLQACLSSIALYRADLCDPMSIERVIREMSPFAVFNEADQDNVDWSFATPAYSADVTAGAVLRLLESVRVIDPTIRVFQPVSALMFGNASPPQSESAPLNPLSPYAVCKAAAFHACRMYRQVYNMHVTCGIMFNHTSLRRRGEYLLHMICRAAVQIAAGKFQTLAVGDPDLRVDIGYAQEYAEASYRALMHHTADDFAIGSGCAWTVREMCEEAFRCAGVEEDRQGGYGSRVVRDEKFCRPGPQPVLVANVTKAQRELGWVARTGLETLIRWFVLAAQKGEL